MKEKDKTSIEQKVKAKVKATYSLRFCWFSLGGMFAFLEKKGTKTNNRGTVRMEHLQPRYLYATDNLLG